MIPPPWCSSKHIGRLMTRQLSKPLSTDAALVERLRAGDATAVADLSQRYGANFSTGVPSMKNREDAEEVAQDVLLKVFKKIKAFRGDAQLSSGSTASRSTPRCRGCGRCASRVRRKCQSARSPCRVVTRWSPSASTWRITRPFRTRPTCGRSCGIASPTRWISCRRSTGRRSCCATSGTVDRRGERIAEGEKPDAEVAPASRPAGAARAALGVRGGRRPAPRRVTRATIAARPSPDSRRASRHFPARRDARPRSLRTSRDRIRRCRRPGATCPAASSPGR